MGRAAESKTGSAGGYSTPVPALHASSAVREFGRRGDDGEVRDDGRRGRFDIWLGRGAVPKILRRSGVTVT